VNVHAVAKALRDLADALDPAGATEAVRRRPRSSGGKVRILECLKAAGQPMNAMDIAARLDPPIQVDVIRTTLSKLLRAGVVRRVNWGVYVAA
jgi:Fe2+ or Zn2+ uptake regulation protein